jgi:VanZ family protein
MKSEMSLFKTKIIIFVVITAVTVMCHSTIKQYEKSGPELLLNKWSLQASKDSTAEINENVLYLFSMDHSKSVNIIQEISSITNGALLYLSADIKCENVSLGEEPWNRARFLLLQYDREGNRLDLPHHVASIIGTRKWASYNNYFTIEPETKKIRVTAQLSKSTGAFWLKNIHLYPVAQSEVYTWIKYSVLVSWGLYFTFLLLTCFINGKNSIVIRFMLVIGFILIIVGISMPADKKDQLSGWTNVQINTTQTVSEEAKNWDLTKVGHFCFFLVFGLSLFFLLNHEPDIIVFNNILLLAGGTEIAQLYIGGRGPHFWDFIIDVNGGLFAFVLMKLFAMIRTED